MGALGQRVSIWPAPTEYFVSAQKLETQRMLQHCAISLDLQHPLVTPVESNKLVSVVESIFHGTIEAVVKREYSGFSKNVITPYTPLADAMDMMRKSWGEEARHNDEGLGPRTTWFLQPFLPHLIRLGELRTYIVDGTIYYIVSTTPVEFDPANTQYTGAQWIRPLSSFRLVSYPPESLIYSNFLFSFFAAMIQINQTTPKSLGG